MSKQEFIIIAIGFLALFGVVFYFTQCDGMGCGPGHQPAVVQQMDFDACETAGNPIMESYPRRCSWPTGVVVTEEIDEPAGASEGLSSITVIEPVPSAAVGLPMRLQGIATVQENRVYYRLNDADTTVLAEGDMEVEPDGTFDTSFNYTEPFGTSGTLDVYEASLDGTPSAITTVPVQFLKVATTPVIVFYMDLKTDPDRLNCEQVTAFSRRISATEPSERATLEALLSGPTDKERLDGAQTSLPERAIISSFTIENGVATIDFEPAAFVGVAGSCRVGAARAQIEETLKQFETVTSVRVLVGGEEGLQP